MSTTDKIDLKRVVDKFSTPDHIHKYVYGELPILTVTNPRPAFFLDIAGKALMYRSRANMVSIRNALRGSDQVLLWGLFQFEKRNSSTPIQIGDSALDAFDTCVRQNGANLVQAETRNGLQAYRVSNTMVKTTGGYFRVHPTFIFAEVQLTDPVRFAESICSPWGRRGSYGCGMVHFSPL